MECLERGAEISMLQYVCSISYIQEKLKSFPLNCRVAPPPTDGMGLKGTLLIGRNEGPRVCVGDDPDGILLLSAQRMSSPGYLEDTLRAQDRNIILFLLKDFGSVLGVRDKGEARHI